MGLLSHDLEVLPTTSRPLSIFTALLPVSEADSSLLLACRLFSFDYSVTLALQLPFIHLLPTNMPKSPSCLIYDKAFFVPRHFTFCLSWKARQFLPSLQPPCLHTRPTAPADTTHQGHTNGWIPSSLQPAPWQFALIPFWLLLLPCPSALIFRRFSSLCSFSQSDLIFSHDFSHHKRTLDD